MPEALITLSGGIDGVVLAHWAQREGYDPELLFFDYGQPALVHELGCARFTSAALARELSIARFALTLPAGARSDLSFVLGLAAEYALRLGHRRLFSGSIGEDRGARPRLTDFMRGVQEAAVALYATSETSASFEIRAPFIEYTKADVIALGRELGVDFAQTWSCSFDGAAPCGSCRGCVERANGFRAAGLSDPLLEVASSHAPIAFGEVAANPSAPRA